MVMKQRHNHCDKENLQVCSLINLHHAMKNLKLSIKLDMEPQKYFSLENFSREFEVVNTLEALYT